MTDEEVIKKTKRDILKFIIGLFIALILAILYLFYYLFFSMSRLPEGEFLEKYTSPNGTYELSIYLSEGEDNAIRGELNSSELHIDGKNIYWEFPKETVYVKWIDNDTVQINGHELELPNSLYDSRRE